MKKIHELKLEHHLCEDVMTGRKTFEIRSNDRLFQTGDLICFQPVYESGLSCEHPIKNMVFKILYVASGYGIREGYVVLGIQKCKVYARKKK